MEIQETSNLIAWEEPNGQQYKPSVTLALLRQRLEEAKERAEPCPPQEAMRMLGVNLVLCSPSGMSEADRVEWLKAALMTIGDCPRDLLEQACFAARKVCDHPAKIVPFICNEIGDRPKHRLEMVEYAYRQIENFGKPKIAPPQPEPVRDLGPITQEEVNALPLFLRKSWLNLGMITQEQFDAAWRDGDEA